MEVQGGYIVPGLIDGHLHLESSMLTPRELARALLPLGTTTVVADPHEIANVWGARGLDYVLAASRGLPLDFFFHAAVLRPGLAPGDRRGGARPGPWKITAGSERVLGLAEVMNFPAVVRGDRRPAGRWPCSRGPVDGHAPLLSGRGLNAYRLAGIGSDHECSQLSEAREKLDLGFYLMVREGSLAKNLTDLLPAVTAASLRRTMLVTDDCHPEDLLESGHLNALLQKAVSLGLDPLQAITLATLNPAEYFRLADRGAVAPGLKADLVVDWRNPRQFRVRKVFKAGRLLADAGGLLAELPDPAASVPATAFKVREFPVEALSPAAAGELVKVIGLIPGQLLTAKRVLPTPVREAGWWRTPPGPAEAGGGGAPSRHRQPGVWVWCRASGCNAAPALLPWPMIPTISWWWGLMESRHAPGGAAPHGPGGRPGGGGRAAGSWRNCRSPSPG